MVSFVFADSMRDVLGFHSITSYEEYNLSPNPVDIFSFDDIFIHANLAQVVIFKSKRSRSFHNFTMDVNPGNKYIKKFRGGIQWYMMESKDVISNIRFKLKYENIQLVSLNGQSVSIRLSIKEV